METVDFSLPDQNGKIHKLSEYRGSWVILYFYPKDGTPGCTKEACGFRDSIQKLTSLGAIVLGVSKDSITSHKKFAEKYRLNFPILSDEEKKVIKAYHAWGEKKIIGKTFQGTTRITYLIDKTGKIVKTYPRVNPLIHASQIITDIQKLS